MKAIRGTNQYQTKRKSHWKYYLYVYYLIVLICVSNGIYHKLVPALPFHIMSPLGTGRAEAQVLPAEGQPQGMPEPTLSQSDTIKQEITTVFGVDSAKAFKLLSCENHALNPLAINDNTKWGGIGQDIGLFQINTIWQGVSNKAFLFDPSINIRIAHNIYVRDGYSFKLWTCGKDLRI